MFKASKKECEYNYYYYYYYFLLLFPVQKTNRYLIIICSKQLIDHLEGLVKQFFFRSNGSNIPYCLDQNANSRQCLMQKLPSNDIPEPLGAFKRMLEPRDVS